MAGNASSIVSRITNATAGEEEEQQLPLSQASNETTVDQRAVDSSLSQNATISREEDVLGIEELGTDSEEILPGELVERAADPLSDGVYRIPYLDGTQVKVSRDHTNHKSGGVIVTRYDMSGDGGDPPVLHSGRLLMES